jgi:Fe-coproporphyrin III synthase
MWITMTINTLNFISIKDVIEEWKDNVNKIGFQFHIPFVKDDPLWMPYGEKRNKIVDELIKLQREYPKFVINNEKQLKIMKGNLGGKGTTPIQCPTWAILSLDHKGKEKRPC